MRKTEGVLPIQELRELEDQQRIFRSGPGVPAERFQPASLDLGLGGYAYRLRSSFLPGERGLEERLPEFEMGQFSLHEGAVLETNRPYLAVLEERLDLPEDMRGLANPRSSTGRIDVFTRLLALRAERFDEVSAGYRGQLFLEIIPRSFAVRVKQGMSLSQIRLIRGDPGLSSLDLQAEHRRDPIVLLDERPVEFRPIDLEGGMPLSVDLSGDANGIIGYRAKRNSRLLDMTSQAPHPQEDFWEPLRAERGRRLMLEPEEFYLLGSRESVRIPPHLAAEMVALDPRSGEFRAHYAGFFDPGFGYDSPGTRAVMEIRAHDVPFSLEHGQQICRLEFQRLTEPARITYGREAGSNYQGQGIRLSRLFGPQEELGKKLGGAHNEQRNR